MAINRELSQFGRLVQIIDNVSIGIGTTSNLSIGFGTITATTFSGNHTGSGTNLTGIVTSIVAGTNITISGSTGQVTINSTASGGGGSSSQWTTGVTGITTTSSVGIKSTSPTSALDVTGDVKISGIVTATDFNSTSDETLKKNIQIIENPIEKVLQLNGVTFNWKDNDEASVGVIAQDVEKVFPELVHGLEPKTVSYNGLVGLLIECIKHQQHQINELKEHMIGS